MPKFNGQNKRRRDPRYFLNEAVEKKEEIKEEEDSWEKYDDLMAKAGASGEEWQAPWNSTEEMIDKLADQAREASKAVHGYKMDVEGMTIAQLRDLLHSMGNSDVQRAMDDEAQREDDMATGMQADELDNRPKRAGMGRGPMEEEEKKKGNYDDGDDEDEKCDYVPCGDRKPSSEKKSKKSEIKEMIAKELASLLSESYEEVAWSGRDPYDDDGRVDPSPIPDDQLTPTQVLSDEVEEFIKKYNADPGLSVPELDRLNAAMDGLWDNTLPEKEVSAIADALKRGDQGLVDYFRIQIPPEELGS